MEDLQDKIIELMDLFDGEVTTADKIDRPQQALDREAYKDFMDRNPMAGGGMLVQPSADGSRPGYAKATKKIGKKMNPDTMNNISDAFLKAYADDDIAILSEKTKVNPQGLLTKKDSKAGLIQKIATDEQYLNAVVNNTGLDKETILNMIEDRDAYLKLEKPSGSQATRFADRIKFVNQAEKWLLTNAKRYADPIKFEKAFIRTFGKDNLITKTIKANITGAREKGRVQLSFSPEFVSEIMGGKQGIDIEKLKKGKKYSFNSTQFLKT